MTARAPEDPGAWPAGSLPTLLGLCVAAGVLLRLGLTLLGKGLWADEAALLLAVEDSDLAGLFRPLERAVAPPGYLLLLRALSGGSIAWLRLPSLLAGILALVLFARLARRHLAPLGALLATWMLAASRAASHYSWELKQYSLEALVTCGLLACFLPPEGAGDALEHPWRTALGLALCPWFSLSSVFLLPWVGWLLAREARARGRSLRDLAGPLLLLAASAAAFLAWYRGIRATYGPFMASYWGDGFAPLPWPPGPFLEWHRESLALVAAWLGGLPYLELLGAALLLAGAVATWRRGGAARALLLGPPATLWAAALLGLYPLPRGEGVVDMRVLVYAIPLVLLLMGEGLAALARRARPLGLALGGVAALGVLGSCAYPRLRLDLADELAAIRRQGRPGDLVVVTHFLVRPLEVLRRRGRLPQRVEYLEVGVGWRHPRDLGGGPPGMVRAGIGWVPLETEPPPGSPPLLPPRVRRVWWPQPAWARTNHDWRLRELQATLARDFREVELPDPSGPWRTPPAALRLYERVGPP